MDIETIRNYCLALPGVTEDMPFGPDVVVFRLEGKIFLCLWLPNPDLVQMKCDPEYALELREAHSAIEGAFHWNKKHWNQLWLGRGLGHSLIFSLIDHAYCTIARRLPKKLLAAHPEYLSISDSRPDKA